MHQRIGAFQLWCWRRLFRAPWTARWNQSILKEINPEYSLEGLMLKMKLQYFWPPDVKNWLIGKDPDAGKDWRWEEKGATEGEMVGWHHWCNGHEFEQTLGDGEGQGSLVCCSPWGCKELDTTEWLENTVTTLAWGEQRLGEPERTEAEELVGYAVLEKVTYSCCWKGLPEFRTFGFIFLACGRAMACGILVPWLRIVPCSGSTES